MHMISKNDLNSAEMDTLTKSCSPTIVITANGEVQTHEEATVYVKEKEKFLTMKVLENTPPVLSLGKLRDQNGYSYEWIICQKPHLIKNGIRIQCNTENFGPIVVPGLSTSSSSSSPSSTSMTPSRQEIDHPTSSSSSSTSPTTTASSDSETREREDQSEIDSPPVPVSSSNVEDRTVKPVVCSETNQERSQANPKSPKTNKKETTIERGNPLFADSGRASLSSEIPEWLQEFRENLVDDRVPEHRDSHASSSHEVLWNPHKREVRIWVSTVFILISLKTEIARSVRGPKLPGPHAEDAMAEPYLVQKIFGDLKTADHKVLTENRESRNNHRYAIVVQDVATQWIQSYPCKTKTSQETQRSLQKFLEPNRKPTVIYTDNSLEFGKACEDLSWNHCTSTPYRSETNGIAGRAVCRVKEGTSAVLLQLGLNENWWADSMERYTYLRKVTDLLSDGKTPYERRFGQPFKGPIIPFGSLVEYHPKTAKDQSRIHQFGKKVLPRLFFGYALYVENLEG